MIGGCKLGTRDMYCKYSRPCHRETSTTNDWTAWRGQPFIFLSYTNYYLEGLLQLVLCHNLDPDMPWTDGSYDRAVPTAVTRICPRVPTSSTSDTFQYGSSRQLVSHLLHFMFLVIFKELTFHRFSSIYTSIKRFRPQGAVSNARGVQDCPNILKDEITKTSRVWIANIMRRC